MITKTLLILFLVSVPALLAACAGSGRKAPTPTPIPPVTVMPTLDQHIFYVAPGGSDEGPGTQDQPWATINHAAGFLRPGDTVYLREGRYTLAQQVRPRNSGQGGAWITYAGYPGESAILDAGAMASLPPASAPPYPQDNGAFQIEGGQHPRNLLVRDRSLGHRPR